MTDTQIGLILFMLGFIGAAVFKITMLLADIKEELSND